jgi:hypothetical protein
VKATKTPVGRKAARKPIRPTEGSAAANAISHPLGASEKKMIELVEKLIEFRCDPQNGHLFKSPKTRHCAPPDVRKRKIK